MKKKIDYHKITSEIQKKMDMLKDPVLEKVKRSGLKPHGPVSRPEEKTFQKEGAKRHIVIIGGGFGGISAAKQLKGADVEITIIDKSNHHLFQPLLYQVATASLSPGDIAVPIRSIVGKDHNVRVLLGEVIDINVEGKNLALLDGRIIFFDQLVLAAGAKYNYFGHDDWEGHAPGLKSVNDALRVRERILLSLEKAEQIREPHLRKPYLTYVIIGGGPTGVEMAGAIAEITKKDIIRDYRNIKGDDTRIILVEAGPSVLNGYAQRLQNKAKEMLEGLGVEVLLNTPVTSIEKDRVLLPGGFIEASNIIWAAGVIASPLVKLLKAEHDRNGRVMVNSDLSLPGNPDIYVIGDAAHVEDRNGKPLPAVASVATQQGKFVGKLLRHKRTLQPDKHASFKYFDKGTMATIGRSKAVADIKGFKASGFVAWILWSFIHVLYLIGYRNRFHVFVEWVWYYFTSKRGVKLITGRTASPRSEPMEQAAPAPAPDKNKDLKILLN